MRKLTVILMAIILVTSQVPAFACTSFQVKAEDGTVVVGRSNEFSINANSQIVFEPAGNHRGAAPFQ